MISEIMRPSSFAMAILHGSAAQRRQIALAMLAECKKPGRAGVLAAVNTLNAFGQDAQPSILRAMWAAGLSREAWATALLVTWVTSSSSRVIKAAGDNGTLKAWFDYAQLTNPPPFLRHVCVASDELPERIRLYRGGTRDPVALGGGLSWSRHRGTAAWYVLRRVRELGGKPIVVRAMVRCDQIAMVTRNTESEWVAFDVAGAELVPTSASMLRKLADKADARAAQPHEQARLQLSLDDEAGWCGWAGETVDAELEANIC